MINGVSVEDVTVDDYIDNRDSGTLWFWPKGYGNVPAFELPLKQVLYMLESFYTNNSPFGDECPDEVLITITMKRKGNEDVVKVYCDGEEVK